MCELNSHKRSNFNFIYFRLQLKCKTWSSYAPVYVCFNSESSQVNVFHQILNVTMHLSFDLKCCFSLQNVRRDAWLHSCRWIFHHTHQAPSQPAEQFFWKMQYHAPPCAWFIITYVTLVYNIIIIGEISVNKTFGHTDLQPYNLTTF